MFQQKIKQKIKELMKRGDLDDNVVATIDHLMNFRHQQYSEILKMPIPLVNEIMKRIEKEQKEMKKAMKK